MVKGLKLIVIIVVSESLLYYQYDMPLAKMRLKHAMINLN